MTFVLLDGELLKYLNYMTKMESPMKRTLFKNTFSVLFRFYVSPKWQSKLKLKSREQIESFTQFNPLNPTEEPVDHYKLKQPNIVRSHRTLGLQLKIIITIDLCEYFFQLIIWIIKCFK